MGNKLTLVPEPPTFPFWVACAARRVCSGDFRSDLLQTSFALPSSSEELQTVEISMIDVVHLSKHRAVNFEALCNCNVIFERSVELKAV